MSKTDLTLNDLEHMAGLSKLNLDFAPTEQLLSDMQHVLNLFEALDVVDAHPMPETGTTIHTVNPEDLREDVATQEGITDVLPQFAPRFNPRTGYFDVPVVIDD